MAYKYAFGIVGGTFDRLHKGHMYLLDASFTQAKNVTVGIATAKLHQQKKLSSLIEPYKDRENAVLAYLTAKQYLPRATITPIDDMYGNTLQKKESQAIFFTESNKENVSLVNEARQSRGLESLALEQIDLLYATDGKIISSERIRKGEIDREGNVYYTLFQKESYTLPNSARDHLRKPFGQIHEDVASIIQEHPTSMIIAVGDIVSLSFYKIDHQAAVSIVDLKSRRSSLKEEDIDIFYAMPSLKPARNAAGTIEHNAVERVNDAIDFYLASHEQQTIVVAGEEDLLTIPAILFAPLGSVVVYGLYGKGAVAVEVTEEKKKEFAEIFRMFS